VNGNVKLEQAACGGSQWRMCHRTPPVLILHFHSRGVAIHFKCFLFLTAIEAGARQQALGELLSLIEGRDLLLTHAEKQLTQLHRQLADKQAS